MAEPRQLPHCPQGVPHERIPGRTVGKSSGRISVANVAKHLASPHGRAPKCTVEISEPAGSWSAIRRTATRRAGFASHIRAALTKSMSGLRSLIVLPTGATRDAYCRKGSRQGERLPKQRQCFACCVPLDTLSVCAALDLHRRAEPWSTERGA